MYAFMCMQICVCWGAGCICTSVNQKLTLSGILYCFSPYFFEAWSLIEPELTIWLGWLASELSGAACLLPPHCWGYTHGTMPVSLHVCEGWELRCSCLRSKFFILVEASPPWAPASPSHTDTFRSSLIPMSWPLGGGATYQMSCITYIYIIFYNRSQMTDMK